MTPWWRRIDILLLLCTAVLSVVGLLMIYSATGQAAGPGSEVGRQAIMLGVGVVLLALFSMLDHGLWARLYWGLYGLVMALLVGVLAVGTSAKGAQRWIDLGPLGSFQPSEPAKLLLILALARILAGPGDEEEEPQTLQRFALTLALLALPLGLIMLQPDLGTALATGAVGLVMMYAAGVPARWLLGLVAAALAAFPFVLHDYQRERLLIFLNPEHDPTGAGWNLIQSRIAIGSGSLWGKGLFLGTQNNLRFVPEHHTDFIFTVVGEELGFVGALAILVLFLYIVGHAFRVASVTRDRFGSLVAVGLGTMFAFHVLVNIGMTVGLMPVTGIPLPFLSYGGSALLTNLMAIGILTGLWARRPRRPL